MNFFHYKGDELYCEELPVEGIAKKTKTPVYIYSYKTLKRHYEVFDSAFRGLNHMVCYSCKANSNIAVIAVFGSLGGGADIVSGGELFRVSRAGIPPERVVYSGVGKTGEEITRAIKTGILMINIESEGELNLISKIATRMKKEVGVSIRVNPQIDPKTHPYITTGLKKNKFGIVWEDAIRLYKIIKESRYLVPIGVSSHIGSQILELSPFLDAVRSLREMVYQLRDMGIGIRYLDIGGGLGITYKDEAAPHPEEYAGAIKDELKDAAITLILEPGRVLVGNSGILVARVINVKNVSEKTFVIVDGAMNDLIRPSLYDAYHEIVPLHKRESKKENVDVVGPICESGDFFAKDRLLSQLQEGDLIAIKGAGAYGFSMSSNYNSRRRPPEVLVVDEHYFIIRKRETLRDLIRGESIPEFLRV